MTNKRAFTLAGADAHQICSKRRLFAFTLAEILTTLTIIGVIAVLTVPAMQSDITSKTLEKQKLVFNKKFEQALHVMQLKGELAKEYESTADFVYTMNKYMHINKICNQNELKSCIGSKIKESKSVAKFEADKIHTSTDIGASFPNESDLAGIIFADGTRAIITLNTDCVISDMYNTNADVTSCIAMIYDVNGSDGSSILGEDILTKNLTYASDKPFSIGEVFTPIALTKKECEESKDYGCPIKECNYETDYWAGAVDKCCRDGSRLPTRMELHDLAKELYGQNVNYDGSTTITPSGYKDDTIKTTLGLGSGTTNFWSSEESSAKDSCARDFSESSTNGVNNYTRSRSTFKAFCLGDE